MSKVELNEMPINEKRGICAAAGIVCMLIGAGVMWGFGAAVMVTGANLFLMALIDEALERITETRRGPSGR